MCGIAGIVGPAPDRVTLLRTMSDALVHRGPDESGTWVGDHAALAISRLRSRA
jgi:asparagine synthase (glutamine-hydrolysing)